MQVKGLDHLVITTQDLAKCLHFYVDILGMTVQESKGRYALHFGSQKFNIHTKKSRIFTSCAISNLWKFRFVLSCGRAY
ncbi:VOC family protein [Veillonella intestinalis]|uniref:VOC family protein n=1 Tax=Veillonella intestinalis TaxID=2941341 RepID=UPI00203FA73C|nr:VOC family protein [Veillonella intestinalis]